MISKQGFNPAAGAPLLILLIAATLALALPCRAFAGELDRPEWADRSSYIVGDLLYLVGVATGVSSVEEGRQIAYQNALRELNNVVRDDRITSKARVLTQRTYEEKGKDGLYSVYRLCYVRVDELGLKSAPEEAAVPSERVAPEPPALTGPSATVAFMMTKGPQDQGEVREALASALREIGLDISESYPAGTEVRKIPADIVFIAATETEEAGQFVRGLASVTAQVSLKAVSPGTGKAITSATARASGAGGSKQSASTKALEAATRKAYAGMKDALQSHLAREAQSGRVVALTISGIADMERLEELLRVLKGLPGVVSARSEQYAGGTGRLSVTTRQDARAVMDRLVRKGLVGVKGLDNCYFAVSGATERSAEAELLCQ